MKTKNTKTVTITKTVTKKQTGQITIDVPDKIANEDICDWLYLNEHLWLDTLTRTVHLSITDYDPEFDETRYDVFETKEVQTYGGHL
mgnify:FL=1